MKVEFKHDLPEERALTCAENIFKNLAVKYEDEFSNLEQEIDGNIISFSFRARGMSISGNITVLENEVVIESRLPFAARMFQGLIENKIKENGDEMLNDCKNNI